MTKRVMVLSGPNLNLLGEREPEIYGATTLDEIRTRVTAFSEAVGTTIEFLQSNHEGVLVDHIQRARKEADAIVFNPAGYSFTSVALLDALKTFKGPIIEVHISNIHARDKLHQGSIISTVATGVICGLGPYGYVAGVQAALHMLAELPKAFSAGLPGPKR